MKTILSAATLFFAISIIAFECLYAASSNFQMTKLPTDTTTTSGEKISTGPAVKTIEGKQTKDETKFSRETVSPVNNNLFRGVVRALLRN